MTARRSWEFSDDVISKAKGFVRRKVVTPDPEVAGVYFVQGSAKKPYRVQTDASLRRGKVTWASCTCPHGRNLSTGTARCSHVVAVLMVIREERRLP